MDEFLLVASIVLFLLSLILPIIAFVLIYTTRKRLKVVESELGQREKELRYLYEQSKARPAPAAAPAAPAAVVAAVEPATLEIPAPMAPSGDTSPAVAEADDADVTAPVAPAAEPAPPPPFEAEPMPAEPPEPRLSLEQRVATIFTRVGAGALLLGVLYFFKYAVDNEWIGPMGRVLVGAVVGLAILAGSEIIRPRTRAGYVHALVGVGLSCLYIAAYAASAFYQLIPTEIAFGANAVILLLGAALAHRHRGEAILVLVLIAGFMNPVLLSTGTDRPFALFAYLFAMTSVVLVVATHHGFRFAVPLSVLGVAVLFAGWYEKFFQVHDLRDAYTDRPPEELIGAYHDLVARLIPLGAVLVFTAQWMGTAFRLRMLDRLPAFVTPTAIAALILGHVGMTALLFDNPVALGGVMIVLGVASVFSLRALSATRFLLIPMLCAFVLVLGLVGDAGDWNQTAVVALLGVWTAIYVVAFLKELSPVPASVAIFAFAILAAVVLLPSEKALETAAAETAAAAAVAYVAYRAQKPLLTLFALLITLLPMSLALFVARDVGDLYWNPAALGIAVVWAGALGTGPILASEPQRIDLFNLCLSGLGFLVLALCGIHEDAPTLRALFTALTGAAFLGAATRPPRQEWSTILAALALGLFAPAVAFGLSGATITVVWAVLTGVAAMILARANDRVWMFTLSFLALATLVRVLGVDVPRAEHLVREFVWSDGRRGLLALPAFFNFRAYAFFGTGFAFLGGAFFLSRRAADQRPLQLSAGALAVVAYVMLTTVLVVEVRAALLELPEVPPVLLDSVEFSYFMGTVESARAAQHNLLAMASTVVLAAIGTVLLIIGFSAKDAFHRYLGLVVLLGTIAKLVGWDVWNLARIYQVVALCVVGVVLLGSGFLYARLRGLFKSAAVVLLVLTSSQARAEPLETRPIESHLYSHHRGIRGVKGPGDHVFPVDGAIYHASRSGALLEDVRITDDRGFEVPFVMRETAAKELPRFERVRMFDPGATPDGRYRATFEVPDSLEHCEVRLSLEGPAPYLRKTQIHTGESTADMQLISEGALVWALTDTQHGSIRYPRSIARFLRVTLLDDPDATQTRIAGAEVGCDGPRSIPPYQEIPLTVVRVDRNAEKKTTVVEIDVGAAGVPLQTIQLEIKTPEFMRRASLAASAYKSVWPVVSRGVLYRYAGPSRPAQLSLQANGTRKRYLQVEIQDRDDAPLDISGATGRTRVREIIFRATKAGPHKLYTGHEDSSLPIYDLRDLLARGESRPPTPVSLNEMVANPDHGKAPTDEKLPVTERYRPIIGALLGLLLLVLAAWAVRLIRKEEK